METSYSLIGFNRNTDFAEAFHPVPESNVAAALAIAGLAAPIPADLPLSNEAATRIAALIGARIDLVRMDFHLSPHQPVSAPAPTMATAK